MSAKTIVISWIRPSLFRLWRLPISFFLYPSAPVRKEPDYLDVAPLNCLLNEVGFGIGLRLFETVNRDNIASYKSALSASKVSVIEELEDGDLYLEILKD